DGLQTRYAHCSELKVAKGQRVQAGEIVGSVGHTGRATGDHLHFEAQKNGISIDPMEIVNRKL
ncbi:MAG: peptidoglycan DD-metalloendopeptidase family protein, partial [Rhodobacterales bacterium]|nr:peptidoglycan DD-metalloendopeptidase family protein [Rhodobacterales bacterium]